MRSETGIINMCIAWVRNVFLVIGDSCLSARLLLANALETIKQCHYSVLYYKSAGHQLLQTSQHGTEVEAEVLKNIFHLALIMTCHRKIFLTSKFSLDQDLTFPKKSREKFEGLKSTMIAQPAGVKKILQ